MTKPRVVFAYRHALLGGVTTQLLNRVPALERDYEALFVFEQDHGMVGAFPDSRAAVTPDFDSKLEYLDTVRPDAFIVIDTPSFFEPWWQTEQKGALIVEVHTTYTRNISYLRDLTPDSNVAAFFTVSEYMRDRIAGPVVSNLAPINVIPNCLGEEWFGDPTPIDPGFVPLVWVGKLDDHKRWRAGLDLIDRTLDGLPSTDTRPLLVGGYTSRDSATIRAFLAKLRSTPALEGAVWWPAIDYETMPTLYRSVADSGGGQVSTTRNESFGMSIAESVLMGCPTIAPRVGAIPELLPAAAIYDEDDWPTAETLARRMLTDRGFRAELLSTADAIRERVRPERMLAALSSALASIDTRLTPVEPHDE